MDNILPMPPRTYVAREFCCKWESKTFKISGTLDGFIDFAVPDMGTFPLSPTEARAMANALLGAVEDVEKRCLYDADSLIAD
jgi:hypothetical protein